MPPKPYDVTLYDRTGSAAKAILEANPEVRVLSMYDTGDSTGRVRVFGAGASKQFDVSEAESDSAKKQLFLLGAPTSVICVGDLSAISFMVTALRLLLADDIHKLVVISELPVDGIMAMSEPEELAQFKEARGDGRLQILTSAEEPFDVR